MRKFNAIILMLLLTGCAGVSRQCSSCWAEAAGANWIVVQMDGFGRVMRCWELPNTSIDNEPGSDGIYWKSPDGHLVHLSGHYNRVQVDGGDWDQAFKELGMTKEMCETARERYLLLQPEAVTP